jgi:hypothetical protein
MMQNLKIETEIRAINEYIPGNYLNINGNDFCLFKRIVLDNDEVYFPLKIFLSSNSPIKFPALLENAMIDTPGYSWPYTSKSFQSGFTKGPFDLEIYENEYDVKLQHVNRNEIYIMVPSHNYNEEEVIPLLHFYQVLLLLSEKILELARQYGTVAYYQKVEPQHYNPNWEQEMVRLIGLLRERIAVESERED